MKIKSVTYLSPAGTRLTLTGDRIVGVELPETTTGEALVQELERHIGAHASIVVNDLLAAGWSFVPPAAHGGVYHSLVRAGSAATCICGEWQPKLGESVLRSFDEHLLEQRSRPKITNHGDLPLHRTEAGTLPCSTCDGGGCLDCTDPA